MFHWICPECGREIPPAVRHCALCEPVAESPSGHTSATPELASVLPCSTVEYEAAGQTAQYPVPVPLAVSAAIPPPLPALPEIREYAPVAGTLAALSNLMPPGPADASIPELCGFVSVAGVTAVAPAPAEVILAVETPAGNSPYVQVPDLQLPVLGPAPGAASAEHPLLLLAAHLEAAEAKAALLEAAQEEARRLAEQGPAAPGLANLPETFRRTAIAPGPPLAAASFPALAPAGPKLEDAVRSSYVLHEPAPAAITTQMPAVDVLTPRVAAPNWAGRVAEQTALPPETGQSARPRNELLGGVLPSGWLQSYSPAAARAMRARPSTRRMIQPETAARITLPGPTLPAELLSLSQAGLSAIPGFPRRPASSGLPGWMVTLLVMILIVAAGIASLSYFPPTSRSAAAVSEAAAETGTSTYPLAKFVEVTGFRFVVDLNRKSEIHYLVVNHSAAPLTGVNVFVTLRLPGGKTGQPPLARFSFRAPELMPFESKEMTSSIDRLTRTVALPDWQDVRADIEIAQ